MRHASEVCEKKTDHIKIPMNAFMVWAKINRKIMATQYPSFSNLDISKLLGKAWNEMNPDQRKPFINQAKQLRIEHLNLYPEFRQQPRKRHRKTSKNKKSVKDMPPLENNHSSKSFPYSMEMDDFHYSQVHEARMHYEYQPVNTDYNPQNYVVQPFYRNLPSISSLISDNNSYPVDFTTDDTDDFLIL